MMKRLNIRYLHWIIGSTVLLVALITVAFLLTISRTFEKMAEERAIASFKQIVGQAWSQLENMIDRNGRILTAQAGEERSRFVVKGHLNNHDLVSPYLTSLQADQHLYSHFFGLSNDEFLQIIAVRRDARLQTALKAPEGTYFAVRSITVHGNGMRNEVWEFLSEQRVLLGRRSQEATFIPTARPWYGKALQKGGLILTDPYLFSSNQEPGITIATPLPEKAGVLATDISLRSLQTFITALQLPPNGAIAVQDGNGRILAFHGKGRRYADLRIPPLTSAITLDNPSLSLLKQKAEGQETRILMLGESKERFVVSHQSVLSIGDVSFSLVAFSPLQDFLGPFKQAKENVLLITVAVLTVLLPLTYLGARRVANALQIMAKDSEKLKRLDFSGTSQVPSTFLYEINALGEAQCVMHDAIKARTGDLGKAQEKLKSLVENGIKLSREQDLNTLLRQILFGARDIAHCAAATLFLKTDRNTLAFSLRTSDDELPSFEIPIIDQHGAVNDSYVVVYAAVHNQTVLIDDVYSENHFDLSGTKRFSEESGFRTVSMLTVPLSPRDGEVIGLIQLLNALDTETGEVIPFPQDIVGFVEALASQSAVALENQRLLEAQRAMMDALIKLIAGAVDAKSPYTGGHCERMPELAMMLARAACESDCAPLADFRFTTEDEWREFRFGAWLHDCGKVTTPEYVVDKATKLETIHNRIHEIRTRFEVLLRDAEIERLCAVYERHEDRATADARFNERRERLLDDFTFIALANNGDTFMSPEHLDRIRRIAGETWIRHFDDRLGLSQEELHRYGTATAQSLPVRETLLADKPWHSVPRATGGIMLDSRYEWKMKIPENLYNFGEIYNLCITRGTLTDEERFKINEHALQTIVMLEQLPLPKNMRRLPEYAGAHHETMNGSGYPRKLTAEDLSIPARIMAIADIFEALTASDRPYKPMKTLSESIKILSFFKKDNHIDPVLFDLFLTSGVYKQYAELFLKPEQIDEIDVSKFIG